MPESRVILEIARSIAGLDPEARDRMKARLKVCIACPSGAYRRGFCRRREGGCGCNLWLKTQAPSASCPRGHW